MASAGLGNLFDSPSAPPPRRYSPPASPSSSLGSSSSTRSRDQNPLFFSPGSASDSPQRVRPVQHRPRSPVFAPARDEGYPYYAAGGIHADAILDPAEAERRPNGDFEEYLDPFAGLRAGPGDDEEEAAAKRRRIIAKVDGDRLTGDMGVRRLMRAARRFKVKGKGRETEDLRELLNMYQVWAHGMFPKGDFIMTMNRVEAVCRTRRLESAMKGYREAFYPRGRTPTPPPGAGSASEGLNTPTAQSLGNRGSQDKSASPDAAAAFANGEQNGEGGLGGLTGYSSPPLFGNGYHHEINPDEMPARNTRPVHPVEEDGPDWDELMAMEEMDGRPNEGAGFVATAGGVRAGQDDFGGLYE